MEHIKYYFELRVQKVNKIQFVHQADLFPSQ
jgi:hypothetical protein